MGAKAPKCSQVTDYARWPLSVAVVVISACSSSNGGTPNDPLIVDGSVDGSADATPSEGSSGDDLETIDGSLLVDGALAETPSGADAGTTVSVDKGCSDLSASLCEKLKSCSPFTVAVGFGDVATCVERTKLSCLTGTGSPSGGTSGAQLSTCGKAYSALSCPVYFSKPDVLACVPTAGKRAVGSPCGDDSQCTSTFCAKTAAGGCGR
ncbi:MAG: hypothetical protein NVSMB1_23190 [Polyangiales bacterium]